jgi:hypothetical protein
MANSKPTKSWKPGESGNPNGAPKKENTFKAIIERELEKDFINIKDGKNLGNTKLLLVRAWIAHAVQGGSVGHLKELLDRCEGKVPTPYQQLNEDPIDLNELRDVLLEIEDAK